MFNLTQAPRWASLPLVLASLVLVWGILMQPLTWLILGLMAK